MYKLNADTVAGCSFFSAVLQVIGRWKLLLVFGFIWQGDYFSGTGQLHNSSIDKQHQNNPGHGETMIFQRWGNNIGRHWRDANRGHPLSWSPQMRTMLVILSPEKLTGAVETRRLHRCVGLKASFVTQGVAIPKIGKRQLYGEQLLYSAACRLGLI